MSVAVMESVSSQLTQMAMDAGLQSGCVPDETPCPIMAAQIAEEFREFLLVMAACPQSRRLTTFGSMKNSSGPYQINTEMR